MSVIRPISPAFRSVPRSTPERPVSKPEQDSDQNLPMVVQPARNRVFNRSRPGTCCEFTAQLLAGPVQRGLKASPMERVRYFNAYQPAGRVAPVRQQKWA